MPIEFSIETEEVTQRLKPLFAARSRGREAEVHDVDLKAQGNQVAVVTMGVEVSFPASVKSSGYARIPYASFETIFRSLDELGSGRMTISITDEKLIAGPITLDHPGISTQLIGTRIADLPVDASLIDTLALGLRFSPDELVDSGLVGKVMEGQKKATALIEKAVEVLAPFKISVDALRDLVDARVREHQMGSTMAVPAWNPIIVKAAKTLAPLDVSTDALRRMVTTRIKKGL